MADNEEQQLIVDLEKASQILLAAPNLVTSEQRHEAEQVFISFHKTTGPYVICKHILETSRVDYVLFQAASVIKLAVVREWLALDPRHVESLRSYLLRYVIDHIDVASYVRESCVRAVAVIYKRSTLDRTNNPTASSSNNQLFLEIAQLIQSENLDMQAELKLVFTYCLQTLLDISASSSFSSSDGQKVAVLSRFLSITEQILTWQFIPKNLPRRYIGSFSSTGESTSFRPPATWKDVILNRAVVDMIFAIHKKTRYNEALSNKSLQCLIQLASTNGSIFTKDEMQIEYLTYFIDSLLDLLSNMELFDHEALGVSNIINNLVSFSPLPTLVQLNSDRLASFFACLAKLTCSFCRAAANEDLTGGDDPVCLESFEKILDAWRKFVSCSNELPAGFIRQHSIDIFDCYLRCHLSPPTGTRGHSAAADSENIDDSMDDDRDKFSDQLNSIGAFGRLLPEYSVPLLTRLLDERVNQLQNHLQQSVVRENGGEHVEQQSASQALDDINEDLHWLLLIIADVLTDASCEGETSLIPSKIMTYSISSEASQATAETGSCQTIKSLMESSSPGTVVSSPAWSQPAHPVVRLMLSVFRLCSTERAVIDAGLAACLSPQVGRSLMRLFSRWAESYLAPNEAYYAQMSASLMLSFGVGTDSALWTMSFLLNKVFTNLSVWHFELSLITDTLTLLTVLVEKSQRCNIVVKCETLWQIVDSFSANRYPFNILPPPARRQLCRALVLAGSANFDGDRKAAYLQMVLQSLVTRFRAVLDRPDLKAVCHEDAVKVEIQGLLDCFCGVAEAATPNNHADIFLFLSPILGACVNLLDIYHNYEEIVQPILETLCVSTKQLVCYLSDADCVTLYRSCLSLMHSYAKHNIGRRSVRKETEDDQFSDLVTLMQVMTNILCKDFISFAPSDVIPSDVSAGDVVVFGLNIIIPLMTTELLKFPTLSGCYISLVSYMAEIHPAHLFRLPDDTFKSLMIAVEHCMNSCGADVLKPCMELLTSLSSHIYQDSSLHGSIKHSIIARFLTVLFNMLLLESFDMNLVDPFGSAFFTLICCHQEQYSILVNSLLEQHSHSVHYQRLVDAFNSLTSGTEEGTVNGGSPSSPLSLNRAARLKFAHNFECFLVNIRGFLCMR